MDVLAEKLIATLGLIPHPNEGGYFKETYRSTQKWGRSTLSEEYGGERSVGTAIYYLLTPNTLSALHRVQSDEMFHFYLGDPVEQLRLFPNGTGEIVTIGSDILAGETPQTLVPRTVWQGAQLKPGGRFALLGCTVNPGFEFADYEHGDRAALITQWPEHAGLITALTPPDPVIR
ncbi:MAG: cupin domain-containing protein [Rhodospirillaceae bacterium]|nr:cupin domain-containing protein [Rhodospirillaceae bacterium]